MQALCETLDVNAKTRPRLQSAGIQGRWLLAWLLRGMISRGVTDPVGFALSRTLDPAQRGQAGDEFNALASARPEFLLGALRATLHPYRSGEGDSPEAVEIQRMYGAVMGRDMARASALWRLLTGQEDCEGVSVTSLSEKCREESFEIQ